MDGLYVPFAARLIFLCHGVSHGNYIARVARIIVRLVTIGQQITKLRWRRRQTMSDEDLIRRGDAFEAIYALHADGKEGIMNAPSRTR